jgi:hypothetical protein
MYRTPEEERGLQQADVTGCGAAGGRDEVVVEVAGLGVGQGREDVGRDALDVGAEQQLADQPEHAGLADLTQVHAGDAGQRQRAQ